MLRSESGERMRGTFKTYIEETGTIEKESGTNNSLNNHLASPTSTSPQELKSR